LPEQVAPVIVQKSWFFNNQSFIILFCYMDW